MMSSVIVALGANLGTPLKTLQRAVQKMQALGCEFKTSKFYRTRAISSVQQSDFVNGICSFKTALSPKALFLRLESIEVELGKVKKPKDFPRMIDLDILFYGQQVYEKEGLIIPHIHWKERLFVLIPLADLVDEIHVMNEKWNIKKLIGKFPSKEVQEIYAARSY